MAFFLFAWIGALLSVGPNGYNPGPMVTTLEKQKLTWPYLLHLNNLFSQSWIMEGPAIRIAWLLVEAALLQNWSGLWGGVGLVAVHIHKSGYLYTYNKPKNQIHSLTCWMWRWVSHGSVTFLSFATTEL